MSCEVFLLFSSVTKAKIPPRQAESNVPELATGNLELLLANTLQFSRDGRAPTG